MQVWFLRGGAPAPEDVIAVEGSSDRVKVPRSDGCTYLVGRDCWLTRADAMQVQRERLAAEVVQLRRRADELEAAL